MSSKEDQNPASTHASSVLPLPATHPQETHGSENAPTDSHALASTDHEIKGVVQVDHGEIEVKDLGWNEDIEDIPAPLVGGLSNEVSSVALTRLYEVRTN